MSPKELYDAIANNKVNDVKKETQIDHDQLNDDGYTPFAWGCLHGSIDVCRHFAESGVDIKSYLNDADPKHNVFSLLELAKKITSQLKQLSIKGFEMEMRLQKVEFLKEEVEALKMKKYQKLMKVEKERNAKLLDIMGFMKSPQSSADSEAATKLSYTSK